MTDRIAFVLAALILAAMAYDLWGNDGAVLFFLSRKLFLLVEYLAFWR